jgi:DNA-binding CsgD family transcriptional regulator
VQAGARPPRRGAHGDGRGSGHGRGRPGPLAVAARVSELLGGIVDPRIVREVVALTGDDLEAATEVVVDAKETGCLEQGPDAWRLVAPLPTRRLGALVTARKGEFPSTLQRDGRLLALGSPLRICVAGTVLDPQRVRELEALGWARFRGRGAGHQVVIADRACRTAVLAEVDDEERATLLGELADAMEARPGSLQREDLLRVARWRLLVGGWSAERFATAAACAHATSETRLAATLARRADQLDGGCRAAVLEAVALTVHGDLDGAIAAERRARARSSSPEETAHVALATAHRHAVGHGRWHRAARSLEEHAEVARSDRSAGKVRAYAALLHALDGDPVAADRVTTRAAGEVGDTKTRVVVEVASAFAAAARLDRPGVKRAAAVVAELSRGHHEVPLAAHLARGLVVLDADARPPQERLRVVAEELDHAIDGPDAVLAWWTTVAGRLHLVGGDLVAANDRFMEAMLLTERADPVRLRPRLAADLALVAALSGLPTEAQRQLRRLDEERGSSTAIAARCQLVEVVVAACEGDQAEARRRALVGGDAAVAAGRLRDAVFAWHLAARFGGDARAALDRLTGEQNLPDHPMVASVRRHALAVADRGAPELVSEAKRLAAAGRYLVAAETAAMAAQTTGDRTAQALAGGLAAACHDVRTPALDGIERVALSPRRGEVARGVVAGLDGAELAERLGLSVRTVNNHLARVYRILGVRGRRELQEVYRADRRPLAT